MIKKITFMVASLAACNIGLASSHLAQSAKTKKHSTKTTKITKRHHVTHTTPTRQTHHVTKHQIISHPSPILLGTWKSHATIMNAKGKFNLLDWTLIINNQSNNFIAGTSSWVIGSNFQTKDHQPVTHQGSEPFIGLFGQQPKHFFLAQTNEHSIMQGQVIDTNHIKLQYIEAGKNAAVAEGIFTRQVDQPPVTKASAATQTPGPTNPANTYSASTHKTAS